jgi:DNA-binding Lrp family transcriptional regulator
MPDEAHELTVYVQSKRVVTTFYHPPSPEGPPLTSSPGASGTPGEQDAVAGSVLFLSDDQAHCVARAEDVAGKRGYKVKVVDLEKVGRVERLIAEHLRGVQKFPVLITPKGLRLEGPDEFTDERLSEAMPAELKSVRALTYIKVHGGDLDRIRALLETFGEVKELHLLTGDWDILVMLDFADGNRNKRRVLDFVTERIRGIPEVMDTSTVVPEYSITKFPFT